MTAASRDEAALGNARVVGRVREIQIAFGLERAPEVAQAHAVAPHQVVDIALEVRSLGDVHRRAGGLLRLLPHAIAAGAEELIQDVVLIGGDDQPPDRQAHAPRDVAGVDVAEVTGGYGEAHLLVVRVRRGEIAFEVIDHLGRDARPVDRVHGADAVTLLECRVGIHLLHEVLAVVEDAAHGDVVDVRVLQRIHLRRLEGRHALPRR